MSKLNVYESLEGKQLHNLREARIQRRVPMRTVENVWGLTRERVREIERTPASDPTTREIQTYRIGTRLPIDILLRDVDAGCLHLSMQSQQKILRMIDLLKKMFSNNVRAGRLLENAENELQAIDPNNLINDVSGKFARSKNGKTIYDSLEGEQLQKLREARQAERCLPRTMRSNSGFGIPDQRKLEKEDSDPTLRQVLTYAKVLDIPVSELFTGENGYYISPIEERAHLLKAMRSILFLRENMTKKKSQAAALCDGIYSEVRAFMPHDGEINPWDDVGPRRKPDELGEVANRVFPVPETSLDGGKFLI